MHRNALLKHRFGAVLNIFCYIIIEIKCVLFAYRGFPRAGSLTPAYVIIVYKTARELVFLPTNEGDPSPSTSAAANAATCATLSYLRLLPPVTCCVPFCIQSLALFDILTLS